MNNIKFGLSDITIVPAIMSNIKSRNEINVFDNASYLPLIVSPMDSVINDDNEHIFHIEGYLTCRVREQNIICNKNYNHSFIGYSLEQLKECIKNGSITSLNHNVLIDTANGHMQDIYDTIKEYKKITDRAIMIGNIANPETYRKYSELLNSDDFIRCSIGNGSACLTGISTGIFYPMGSLIKECYDISCTLESPPKIVADGGFANFDEIIKGLYLGADYIMLGGILSKSLEACGDVYWKNIRVTKYKKWMFKNGFKLTRKYRGMSTKEVQKSWGNKILKTSEGITKTVKVEYTLDKWTENFKDYLKSAMSYTNCKTLKEFKGQGNFVYITQEALKSYKK